MSDAATGGNTVNFSHPSQARMMLGTGHFLKLHGMQAPVQAAFFEEFLVRSDFGDPAAIQDDDAISVL